MIEVYEVCWKSVTVGDGLGGLFGGVEVEAVSR